MLCACLLLIAGPACSTRSSGDKASVSDGSNSANSPDGSGSANTEPKDANTSSSTSPSLLYARPELMLPKSLHAGQEYLYWHESNLQDGGLIMQARRDGTGTPIAVAKTNLHAVRSVIASDSNYVFWVEPTRVVRMTHAGQEMQVAMLPAGLTSPVLLYSGDTLYVAELGCMRVFEVSRDSMEVKLRLSDTEEASAGGESALIADDDTVYCAGGGNGKVVAIPRNGTAPSVLVTLELGASGLSLVTDVLYILSTHPSLGQFDQRILRMPKDGSQEPELLVMVEQQGNGSNLIYLSRLDSLYWFNGYTVASSLLRYSIDTQQASAVLTNISTTASIDEADGILYWAQTNPAGIWTMRP